jgi:group I intron endonuclease
MQSAEAKTAIVYQARNLVNGHRYIGFTTQGFEKRVKQHLYYASKSKRYRFQHAIAKYGVENFVFGVLADFGDDHELAKLYEREAIEKYLPEYNLMLGGDAHIPSLETRTRIAAAHKGKKWPNRPPVSDETRAKLSAVMKGKASRWLKGRVLSAETRAKISAGQKGHPQYNTKPMSEESRRKLSERFKGRKPWNTGVVFDEDRRKKMSERRKSEHLRDTLERRAQMRETAKNISNVLRKPVECVTDGRVFESIAAAANFYGVSKGYMASVIRGRFPPMRGLVFRYIGPSK